MNISRNMSRLAAGISSGLLVALALPLSTFASSSPVVVTPSNTQGWSSADTRPGGAVNFVSDPSSPLPAGALQLTTDATTTAKAQYLHNTSTQLSDVTKLSYSTKQNAAIFAAGLPSYQLPTCLYGVTATGCVPSPNANGKSFATFVYEPYVDQGNAAVQQNTWQSWNVSSGKFWSTRTEGGVIASQGTYTYTLPQLKAFFPNAVVIQYGVNVGSNNPGYNVETDAFVFNDITYDFEQFQTPKNKDDCKNDGYKNLKDQNGNSFKNQGQCVSSVASAKDDNTTADLRF